MIVQVEDATGLIVGYGDFLAPAEKGFRYVQLPDSALTQLAAPGMDYIDANGGLVSQPPVDTVYKPVGTQLQARNGVVTVAQSAVGVGLGALTAQQQRALLACLLYKAGALDENLTVQPLEEWL